MRLLPALTLFSLALTAPCLPAGVKEVAPPPEPAPEAVLNRVYAEGSYTWEGGLEEEGSDDDFTDADTWFAEAGYEHLFPLNMGADWFIKAGLQYSYLGIGETNAPLPDMIQNVVVPLGLVWRNESNIPLPKFSLTLNPGVYFSEDISDNDFDIPVTALYGFDVSYDLRLYVGAFGGLMSKYGVLPGGGLVWRFHKGGMLALTFPQAGVYIFPNKDVEIFAGGEWFSVTGRVDRDEELPSRLRDAILDYREIRVGLGVKYKLGANAKLGVAAGYTVDRTWDYERAGYTLEQDNAPYVKGTFELKF